VPDIHLNDTGFCARALVTLAPRVRPRDDDVRGQPMRSRAKLFLGAQPRSVGFFERLGSERGAGGFLANRRT
jgi:hypothetical protein